MSIARQHLLELAHADLDPRILQLNPAAIRAVQVPRAQLQPMQSDLGWAHDEDRETRAIAFLIGLNTINYMFWSLQSVNARKTVVRYAFAGQVGALAMRAAYFRLWGPTILPDNFRQEPLTRKFVLTHFGPIPDPDSRAALLAEVFAGDTLERLSQELFARITTNGAVTVDEADLIRQAFPRAFGDPYLKRAQLALMEAASFLMETGCHIDTTDLTVCADYQLPRALRGEGLLHYGEALAVKVDGLTLIDADSAEERALRAATVLACEAWASAQGCTTAELDNYLWQRRNRYAEPFHLTFTEAY